MNFVMLTNQLLHDEKRPTELTRHGIHIRCNFVCPTCHTPCYSFERSDVLGSREMVKRSSRSSEVGYHESAWRLNSSEMAIWYESIEIAPIRCCGLQMCGHLSSLNSNGPVQQFGALRQIPSFELCRQFRSFDRKAYNRVECCLVLLYEVSNPWLQ